MRVTSLRSLTLLSACLPSLISADSARGQAFQNLDFEASVLSQNSTFGPSVHALGWSFSGEDQGPTADRLSLGIHIGDVPLQRMATDLVTIPRPTPPPIQGHFSVYMGPAPYRDWAPLFPWMEQTGQIPSDARSIRLLGELDPFGLRQTDPSRVGWHLTLGGSEIPLIELPGGILSGDVTAFAGTTAALRIAMDDTYRHELMGRTNFMFDALRFSPLHYTVLPEPGSCVVALICLAAYRMRWRHRRSSAAN
jgi:hypothetical protein